ncbi:LytR/AlgR family response regulator transcription factor [Nesterenkonia alba]|uniref:LytR/AlgR family response regulator transcription factor n=1 Tax=Nesterenkonia alba TaxID=515814 RepID=UPI0003B3DB50|nr:LytTR family DNA-binding domain-containing protein [Nesterenkonia alba]
MTQQGVDVLVVDDEPPAIAQMQWLLSQEPLARRVHTAANVAQAKHVLDTEAIDVVLLDIHMPRQSGLELARELSARTRAGGPQIIFITADAQPAVEAFELQARDYLLKPVRASRLAEALRRAAEHVIPREGVPQGPPRVSVLTGDVAVLVEIPTIRWVQAQGDYARLHTAENSYLLRIPLAELEEQWQSYGFVRVHRSFVVNLHHVRRVLTRQGRMTLQLKDTELPVSRRLMPHVRERLEAHLGKGLA